MSFVLRSTLETVVMLAVAAPLIARSRCGRPAIALPNLSNLVIPFASLWL